MGGEASAATRDAGLEARDAGTATRADDVWSPLTVMAIVDPIDHGAVGDGETDDLDALRAAVDALPDAGGIVYLPAGATFKKSDLLVITKPHAKLWSPNRQAEIFQSIGGARRRQSLLCRAQEGCGFFGLKLRSDAVERFDALEDDQISADHGSLIEIVGCEIPRVETVTGEAYRAEGDYADVTNQGLVTEASALPSPIPTVADVRLADTSILRTRDVSHAPAEHRAGLHRIHVREAPAGNDDEQRFEQRFEYVVRGSMAAVGEFTAARVAEGDHLSELRAFGAQAYARLLAAQTLALPDGTFGVTYRELRDGDRDGTLTRLFGLLDAD